MSEQLRRLMQASENTRLNPSPQLLAWWKMMADFQTAMGYDSIYSQYRPTLSQPDRGEDE